MNIFDAVLEHAMNTYWENADNSEPAEEGIGAGAAAVASVLGFYGIFFGAYFLAIMGIELFFSRKAIEGRFDSWFKKKYPDKHAKYIKLLKAVNDRKEAADEEYAAAMDAYSDNPSVVNKKRIEQAKKKKEAVIEYAKEAGAAARALASEPYDEWKSSHPFSQSALKQHKASDRDEETVDDKSSKSALMFLH